MAVTVSVPDGANHTYPAPTPFPQVAVITVLAATEVVESITKVTEAVPSAALA